MVARCTAESTNLCYTSKRHSTVRDTSLPATETAELDGFQVLPNYASQVRSYRQYRELRYTRSTLHHVRVVGLSMVIPGSMPGSLT